MRTSQVRTSQKMSKPLHEWDENKPTKTAACGLWNGGMFVADEARLAALENLLIGFLWYDDTLTASSCV